MGVFAGISGDTCGRGSAGANKAWATDCKNVADLTFDADRNITAITMDATQTDPTFKEITFEPDTAFFNQEVTRIKRSQNCAQTFSFILPIMQFAFRKELENLSDCCCLHVIIRDKTGRYHYAGITFNDVTDEWVSEYMITGDGSGNTGADPTADSNEYIQTITANTGYYAPFFIGGEAGIPVTAP